MQYNIIIAQTMNNIKDSSASTSGPGEARKLLPKTVGHSRGRTVAAHLVVALRPELRGGARRALFAFKFRVA